MKRLNNIFEQIIHPGNLALADAKAMKGKTDQYGVQLHIRNREKNMAELHHQLSTSTYKTSSYSTFKVFEPKERLVYRLPYFPDRIAHHAIMNLLEPIFVSNFTADTYSCIKGKGIHAAARSIRKALKNEPATRYCLKLDIIKFYPSVDHDILKALLRRKFKDPRLLALLDEIIDSAPGLPIGNYLSQYLANFYLSNFDHWIKETKGIRHYYRYADDLVILSSSKEELHQLLIEISDYLNSTLKLQVKPNYQVFPVASRGIDFVGYVFYHTHTRLRKSIKQNFARKVAVGAGKASIASYMGWAQHANCRRLINKLVPQHAQL